MIPLTADDTQQHGSRIKRSRSPLGSQSPYGLYRLERRHNVLIYNNVPRYGLWMMGWFILVILIGVFFTFPAHAHVVRTHPVAVMAAYTASHKTAQTTPSRTTTQRATSHTATQTSSGTGNPTLTEVSHIPTNRLPNETTEVVYVGFYLDDITELNEVNETLHFQGYLNMRWYDSTLKWDPKKALVHGKPEYSRRYVDEAVNDVMKRIWTPQLILTSARGHRQTGVHTLIIQHTGWVSYHERFLGQIESPMNFHCFPFDRQVIHFVWTPFLYGSDQVILKPWPQRQGVVSSLHLAQWQVDKYHFKTFINKPEHSIGPGVLKSRYALDLTIVREATYYGVQVFLPLVMIVLASFAVFWMRHNPLVNRVAISITAMLTIVVFQWRILVDIPHVPYLTFVHEVMLFSFVIVGSTIFGSILLDYNKRRGKALALTFQIAYPIFYLIGMFIFFLHRC